MGRRKKATRKRVRRVRCVNCNSLRLRSEKCSECVQCEKCKELHLRTELCPTCPSPDAGYGNQNPLTRCETPGCVTMYAGEMCPACDNEVSPKTGPMHLGTFGEGRPRGKPAGTVQHYVGSPATSWSEPLRDRCVACRWFDQKQGSNVGLCRYIPRFQVVEVNDWCSKWEGG